MFMKTALIILQIVSAIAFALIVLLQEKGSGMGEALGGSSASNFQTSARGAEKIIFWMTLVLLILFVGTSLLLNFV